MLFRSKLSEPPASAGGQSGNEDATRNIASDGKLMVAESKTGANFEPGIPKPLFDTAVARTTQANIFDVSADGQRFLFISRMADATSSLTVSANWIANFKR